MNQPFAHLVTVALLVGACGGQSTQTATPAAPSAGGEQPTAATTAATTAEHHGEGHEGGHHGGGHHHRMPSNLAALHDVLAPVWHSEPGPTRASGACTQAGRLDEASRGVAAASTPEGVDATAWGSAVQQLSAASSALVTECRTPGPGAETRLATLHTVFHQLLDMQRR